MTKTLNLSVDTLNNIIRMNDLPPIKLQKCKGLYVLNFLNQHLDKPFSPSLIRLNIENNQDVQILQQENIYTYLVNQAFQYIPAADRRTIDEVFYELNRNLIALEQAKLDNDESMVAYFIEENDKLWDYLDKTINYDSTIKNINQIKINDAKSIKRSLNVLIKLIKKENNEMAKNLSKFLVIQRGQICLLSSL